VPTPTPRRLDLFRVSPITSALTHRRQHLDHGQTDPVHRDRVACPASAVTTGPRMTKRAESPSSSLLTTSPQFFDDFTLNTPQGQPDSRFSPKKHGHGLPLRFSDRNMDPASYSPHDAVAGQVSGTGRGHLGATPSPSAAGQVPKSPVYGATIHLYRRPAQRAGLAAPSTMQSADAPLASRVPSHRHAPSPGAPKSQTRAGTTGWATC